MSVPTVVGAVEPHLFKFWDAEGVSNPFLIKPTLNGTKMPLTVGGNGLYFIMPKHPDFPFTHVWEELFIVHLIVRGAVVQLDPGGVDF